MDWGRLDALCLTISAAADAEEPAIRNEIHTQKCASSAVKVRTTSSSRNNCESGWDRRHGQLPNKATGRFMDAGLGGTIPKGPPRLPRPASAPSLGHDGTLRPDSRRAALRCAEEAGGALIGWQTPKNDAGQAKKVGRHIKGTKTSCARVALRAGAETPEVMRMWGDLNGVGLGIGDRFASRGMTTLGPGLYDEANGNMSRWQRTQSVPTKQPCSKYGSAAAMTIGIDRTRPKHMGPSQSSSGRQRPGSASAHPRAAFKTIADTQEFANVHDYVETVIAMYEVKPPPRQRRGGVQTTRTVLMGEMKKCFDASSGGLSVSASATEQCINSIAQGDGQDAIAKLNKAQFKKLLVHFDIPVAQYGSGLAKHVSDLWVELVMTPESNIELETLGNGQRRLVRSTAVALLELYEHNADGDSFLYLKHMFTESGALRKDLNTRISRKKVADEGIDSTVTRCLMESFNMSEAIVQQGFVTESCRSVEELKVSVGFPGLMTRYKLHIARVRMKERCLPTCPEFMTSVLGKMNTGSKRVWSWCSRERFETMFPPET